MKLMIASDIHGSAFYCKEMLEAFRRERADRLLLLGDLLYHGPRNYLPQGYAPGEVASMLNAYKGFLLCVRGNCDCEVDQMMLEFPILSDSCLLFLEGRVFLATHGHHDAPPLASGSILLCGHTHVPAWEELGEGVLRLNPGSVTLPKEGSAHSYMVAENGSLFWKDLDGNCFHERTL